MFSLFLLCTHTYNNKAHQKIAYQINETQKLHQPNGIQYYDITSNNNNITSTHNLDAKAIC